MKKFYLSLILYFLIGSVLGQNNVGISPLGYITSMPPEIPTLLSPTDSSADIPEPINLSWQSQIHTSSYSLQVSKESDFSLIIVDQANITDTTFLISGLENNMIYYWRTNAFNAAGESNYSSVWSFTTAPATANRWEIGLMSEDLLFQPPYPNPFKTFTTLKYYLPEQSDVAITIYNTIGEPVRKLVSEKKQSGEYEIKWDGRNNDGTPLPNGIYVGVLLTDTNSFSQTFILNK